MEWEKSAHPPSLGASSLSSLSSAHSVSVPSSGPVYTLAPSALSSPIIPPTSGLGFLRSSPTLASSRGTEAHVLPSRGAGISSRATRLSVARSGTGQSVSGGRFWVSLPRGVFGERDTTVAFGDPSLAEYYLEDLDYDRLSHSQFPLGLEQPPVSLVRSVPLIWFSFRMISNPMISPVLLHIHLAFRLRPSSAVIWGTCIALTESLPGLTHSRGDNRRHVPIFLVMLASLTIPVSNFRWFSRWILPT